MQLPDIFAGIEFDPSAFFKAENLLGLLAFIATIVLFLVAFKILSIIAAKLLKGRTSEQTAMLVRKAIRYTAFVVVAMSVFDRIGLDISALLGAAGIAGIAVGFAAQASISNVISGIFLISEKHFAIGDVVTVGDTTGTVLSIDVLSIKIQTFDNRNIRIPNETIIKSNVVNVTRFPIRRLDIWVPVPYSADLERVRELLIGIARDNIYALDNPEPLIIIDKFDASGINILFGPWFEASTYLELKNSIMIDIKKKFEVEGIAMPYPRIDLRVAEGFPAAGIATPGRGPAGFRISRRRSGGGLGSRRRRALGKASRLPS